MLAPQPRVGPSILQGGGHATLSEIRFPGSAHVWVCVRVLGGDARVGLCARWREHSPIAAPIWWCARWPNRGPYPPIGCAHDAGCREARKPTWAAGESRGAVPDLREMPQSGAGREHPLRMPGHGVDRTLLFHLTVVIRSGVCFATLSYKDSLSFCALVLPCLLKSLAGERAKLPYICCPVRSLCCTPSWPRPWPSSPPLCLPSRTRTAAAHPPHAAHAALRCRQRAPWTRPRRSCSPSLAAATATTATAAMMAAALGAQGAEALVVLTRAQGTHAPPATVYLASRGGSTFSQARSEQGY